MFVVTCVTLRIYFVALRCSGSNDLMSFRRLGFHSTEQNSS